MGLVVFILFIPKRTTDTASFKERLPELRPTFPAGLDLPRQAPPSCRLPSQNGGEQSGDAPFACRLRSNDAGVVFFDNVKMSPSVKSSDIGQ